MSTEVPDDLLWASKGTFGVDNPGRTVEMILQSGELGWVGQWRTGATQVQVARVVGACEEREELASKERREHTDWEEELASGGDEVSLPRATPHLDP